MKLVAIDYKGKYFILQDVKTARNSMDYVLPDVDTEHIVNNEEALKEHVKTCLYYGIPAYIGGDKIFQEKVNKMYSDVLK